MNSTDASIRKIRSPHFEIAIPSFFSIDSNRIMFSLSDRTNNDLGFSMIKERKEFGTRTIKKASDNNLDEIQEELAAGLKFVARKYLNNDN